MSLRRPSRAIVSVNFNSLDATLMVFASIPRLTVKQLRSLPDTAVMTRRVSADQVAGIPVSRFPSGMWIEGSSQTMAKG